MKYRGTNQFRKQIHLLDTTHGADWDLIRYFLIVGFLITLFSVHHAIANKWQAAARAVTLVQQVHAAEYPSQSCAGIGARGKHRAD